MAESKKPYYAADYDDLIRFITYYHQIDLIRRLGVREILEVGCGNQTVSAYLSGHGVKVITCDVDADLKPDVVGDIRQLPFEAESFEAAAAFEVLEHLPWEQVDAALKELHRVSRHYVLLSVPYLPLYFEMVVRFPWLRQMTGRPYLDLFVGLPVSCFRRCSPSHHWELGLPGYSLGRFRRKLMSFFRIEQEVRPVLHPLHRLFVLTKCPANDSAGG